MQNAKLKIARKKARGLGREARGSRTSECAARNGRQGESEIKNFKFERGGRMRKAPVVGIRAGNCGDNARSAKIAGSSGLGVAPKSA